MWGQGSWRPDGEGRKHEELQSSIFMSLFTRARCSSLNVNVSVMYTGIGAVHVYTGSHALVLVLLYLAGSSTTSVNLEVCIM